MHSDWEMVVSTGVILNLPSMHGVCDAFIHRWVFVDVLDVVVGISLLFRCSCIIRRDVCVYAFPIAFAVCRRRSVDLTTTMWYLVSTDTILSTRVLLCRHVSAIVDNY